MRSIDGECWASKNRNRHLGPKKPARLMTAGETQLSFDDLSACSSAWPTGEAVAQKDRYPSMSPKRPHLWPNPLKTKGRC